MYSRQHRIAKIIERPVLPTRDEQRDYRWIDDYSNVYPPTYLPIIQLPRIRQNHHLPLLIRNPRPQTLQPS